MSESDVESSKGRSAALIIVAGTVATMLISMVQQALVARHFGVGVVTDAFFMARNVSDIASKLLMTGQVTSVFLPLFAERWLRSREAAWSLTSSVSNILIVLTAVISAIVVVAAPEIVAFSAPGFSSAARAQAIWFLRWLFPLNLLTVQTTISIAMLQSLSRFKAVVLATVAGQLAGLVLFMLVVNRLGAAALVWYTGASAFVTVVYLAVEMGRAGFSLKARTQLHIADLRSLVLMLTPFVASALAAQLSVFYYNRYMSLQGNGAVTILQYAYRTFQLFVSVAVTPWMTVIFPPLTFAAARLGAAGVGKRATDALRFVLVASVPFGLLLAVFAPEVTALLFQRGAFGPGQTASVARILTVFALGVPLQVVQMFLYRLTVALRRVRLVNATWVAMSIGVIPAYAAMSMWWGIRGLALATLASNLFVIIVLGFELIRTRALKLAGLGPFLVRLAAGLTVMLIVGEATRLVLDTSSDLLVRPSARFALTVVAGIVALGLFAWSTHVVALAETREVIRSAQERIGRALARWTAVDA